MIGTNAHHRMQALLKNDPSRRYSGAALFLVALGAWSLACPGISLAEEMRPSPQESPVAPDSQKTPDVVAFEHSEVRPANLYHLDFSKSDSCATILEGLNTRHVPQTDTGRGAIRSRTLMESPLSVRWLRVNLRPWIGVASVKIDPAGSEVWIAKEASRWGTFGKEKLYWLPPDVDAAKLTEKDFWQAIHGPYDEKTELTENQISVVAPPPREDREVQMRKSVFPPPMPVSLWEVMVVDGKAFVLLVYAVPDPSIKPVSVRVLTMHDRRNAEEVCRMTTNGSISFGWLQGF